MLENFRVNLCLIDFKMRLAGVEDDIEIAVASNDAESVTQLMTKKKTLQQDFDNLKKSKQKQKNVEGRGYTFNLIGSHAIV